MLAAARGQAWIPLFAKHFKTKSEQGITGNLVAKFPVNYTTLLQAFNPNKIKFNLIDRSGKKLAVSGEVRDTILDVVIDNDIEIESFGMCEGSIACSTCHVVLSEKTHEHLLKKCPPSDEEWNLLDLASGLTPTSRLGCQVELCKEMEDADIIVPASSHDARS